MILMNQFTVMVTAMNTATVAQWLYSVPLFPPPFEMEAIMKQFVIINVKMKLL